MPFAGQVVRQLASDLGEHGVGIRVDARPERVLGRPVSVVAEVHARQRVVVGDEGEFVERAFDYRMSGVHTL